MYAYKGRGGGFGFDDCYGSYYWGYPYYYCDSLWGDCWGYYDCPYYYSCYYSGYYDYCGPSSYKLTVSTNPSSLGTVKGGGTYTSGSSVSFSITQSTVQVSPNSRYVFDHWSGDYSGVDTSGTVTVSKALTITANYKLQYYLAVSVQPQNAPVPQGAGWYDAGSTATLQNGGQTIGDAASRLVFEGWSVDGQRPQSSSTLNMVMNASHNATALYGQQYYLTVQTDQGVPSGSGWYDAGSTAQLTVSTPVCAQYGVRIVFNGWQGDTYSQQSTAILMDGPKTVVATWRTDYTVLYETIAAGLIVVVLASWLGLYMLTKRKSQSLPK